MTNILIVSTNAIGDTYISLSCLNPMENNFKDVNFTIICKEESCFLLESFDIKNKYIINNTNIIYLIKLILRLRKTKYDYCFSFFPGRLNSLFCFFSRSIKKFYYRNITKKTDWYNDFQYVYINNHKTNICWTPNLKYLDRVRLILDINIREGYSLEKPKFIFTFPNYSNNNNYLIINFSSKEKNRRLPFRLIDDISLFAFEELNWKTIVIDYYDDYKIKYPIYTYKYNDYNLKNTVSLLLNSLTVITVDSFLLHLIDAYNIRAIAVFGPTNPLSVIQNTENIKIIKSNPIEDIKTKDILEFIKIMIPL